MHRSISFSFISQHPSDLKMLIWFGSSILLPPVCPHKNAQFTTTVSKNTTSTYLSLTELRTNLEAKAAARYVERVPSEKHNEYLQQQRYH
jgi:hypothetical protein